MTDIEKGDSGNPSKPGSMEEVKDKVQILPKQHLWEYFILVARVLLAWTLIHYGWGKLTGNQFGVTEATMNQPLKDIDLFRLSWYVADHEPFKSFIGICQIVTAILLVYKPTVILGAFMAIPIWINILMWDMTFMGLYTPFTIRLLYYLLLTFLIIWHHKDKVLPALKSFIKETRSKFSFPLWAYLLLPVFCICLDLIGAFPNAMVALFKHLHK